MAALAFIRMLESRGLLDPEIISELTKQVETSKVRITPEAIARLLVENGQLTRFQATKLITELNETVDRSGSDPSAALRGGRPIELDPQAFNDHDSVEDLIPEDLRGDVIDAEIVDAEVVEDDEGEEEIDVEVVGVAEAISDESDAALPDHLPPRTPRSVPKKNSWESFRILGIGSILLLLLVILVPLLWWTLQGSANEAFETAKSAYEGRDYPRAAKAFSDYAYSYPRDENASRARVLSVFSLLREDAERVTDPTVALKNAQSQLPGIASEDALPSLRSDLTDILMRIAEKFISRIESLPSLSERQELLKKLEEHLTLIRDPRYISAQERTQNTLRIQNVEEGVSRASRGIVRDQDRLQTIEAMTKANEAKEVSKTYEARREVVRKHPVLEHDAELNELLKTATQLQQGLVANSPDLPELSTERPPTNVVGRTMLVNRSGKGTASSQGPVFLKVKGSLVALNSGDGSILWREFIGNDWTGAPQSITGSSESDVIVHFPERASVQRLSGSDGKLQWEAKFSSRVQSPQIDGEELFVSTQGGDVYCLDTIAGTVKWGKRFPQAVDVPVGGAVNKRRRYVVGNHSNLYVVSRLGGECEEVVYLGHQPGTISVPPVWILNQLIVFINEGPDFSYLKVFETDSDGVNVKASGQFPIRFRGHVVVEPQVDGRKFVVTSNLGEVAIFEVDPSNTKEKVQKMAGTIEREVSPRINWPLMVGTDLYLASNRIAMYQIQVSSQKLNRAWQKEDGDEFTGPPIGVEGSIIHSRIVRGNLGIRVASMDAQSGNLNWETDIGVPVSAVAGKPQNWTAVTSQGALYSLNVESLRLQQPVVQRENAGRNQRLMRFQSPVTLEDGRLVIFNSGKEDQYLLVDPNRNANASRMMSIDFGNASASNDPLAVGSMVVVPLSNSQLALIDPDKARIVGTPFQPTIEAGEKATWLNPVLLADKQSVVVADQSRHLYRLSTTPPLRRVMDHELVRPLKGRLAVLENTVVAVSINDSGDQLDFFDGIELKLKASLPVDGRFAWGPYAATTSETGVVVAQSEIEGLIATNGKGERLWTLPLERIELRGVPIPYEKDLLIGTTAGEILRISASDGQIVARVNAGEPLSIAPMVFGKAMVVPCDEGVVLILPVPTP